MKRVLFQLCLFSLSGVSRASSPCGRSDDGTCGSPLSDDDASGLLQVPARAQLLQPKGVPVQELQDATAAVASPGGGVASSSAPSLSPSPQQGLADKPDSPGAGQNLTSSLDLSPPCSISGNKCTEVYGSEFQENGAGLSTWDNHGDQVYCAPDNHDEAIKWGQDGTALTIAYLGKAGGKSSTCYVTTPNFCDMGLCDADLGYRSLASRGYMSVDIAVNKISTDLDANQIWPAFWILNWQVADWPTGGELDIAERQDGRTEEHIIVTDTPEWVTELQSVWPSAAMSPDGETHNYGFEWHFADEQGGLNQLDFTIYWDGQKTGQTYSCLASDTSNLGCQYIFRGMADGRMITIFDAESHFYSGCGSASATDNACQQYSMTVSNFKVYRVQ